MIYPLQSRPSYLALITVLTMVLGCGNDGSGGGSAMCGADVEGTVFGLDKGTATLSGTVTLPAGTAAGLTINLMVMEKGKPGLRGVVPDFDLTNLNTSCYEGQKTKATSFTYRIEKLEAGEYQLHLKLKDTSNSEVYNQTADMVVTVGDGAMVMHDEMFAPK